MLLTSLMWQILNWLSLPVIAVTVAILVWRRLYRSFPLFFAFLIITELAGILRFLVAQFGSAHTYFNVYWVSDLFLMIFNFLSVYELFVMRLFPKFYKVAAYRRIFAGAASVIIVAAWVTAFVSKHGSTWFFIESRVLSFILVAMLAFFVALMSIMGRQWSRYDFGIAFGFAVNNAAVLVTSAMWVQAHYKSTNLQQLPLLAFDLSSLIWLYCFATGEAIATSATPSLDRNTLDQARTWESMLKAWLSPGKGKS